MEQRLVLFFRDGTRGGNEDYQYAGAFDVPQKLDTETAPFVGAFADALPKGQVMFITNTIKVFGCVAMLYNDVLDVEWLQPHAIVLSAYALVGLGAAAYSPAKYGILTELLPAEQLVAANGWIEGLTVCSIIIGTVIGGAGIAHAATDSGSRAPRRTFASLFIDPGTNVLLTSVIAVNSRSGGTNR